jgi:beta-glucosidase
MPKRKLLTVAVVASLAAASLSGMTSLAGVTAAQAATTTSPIYLDMSYSPIERAADIVSRMTTAEKAQQMNSSLAPAIPRLGVAAYGWWNEANHGINASTTVNNQNAVTLTNTTSYPTDLALGSSWNPDLVYQESQQIGAEARATAPNNAQNLDFYAPTVNLSRDPRWGRNDESWSEDPTLTADLASQYVDGLQGQDQQGNLLPSANGDYQAIATLKHFAANNSEVNRRTGSSDMTQKQLREYYTAQFASIIQQSHPGSIMSSYNEVNGTPAAASVQLIDTLARQTFGFDGYFTSDCDAIYEIQAGHNWIPPNSTTPVNQYTRTAYALSAGEDLDCDQGYKDSSNYGNTIPTALTQNIQTLTDTFNINDVDVSLVRLFTARIETGEFDAQDQVPWVAKARTELGGTIWVSSNANNAITETPTTLQQAQDSADQSIVLLKNDKPADAAGSLLPLKVPSSGAYKVAVVGYEAHPNSLFLGGYSSVQAAAGAANNIDSYTGVKAAIQGIDSSAQVDYFSGFTGGTSASTLTTVDPNQIASIAAGNYNAVVVVVGTDSTTGAEDKDRTTLALPGAQASLISQVEAANPNTIVYMETMGEVDTSSFTSTTPALLWSSYNGQRQGAALADNLLGKVNPSAHLPFTWYTSMSQIPAITDYNLTPTATTDGRTYMYFTGDVTYPFGYGLSYTNFAYSNLTVNGPTADANGTVKITADVTNNGTAAGATVPQLYVATPFEPASAQDPVKRLEGFDKITLNPGQTQTVTFSVPVSKLAFYNTPGNKYVVDPGSYVFEVSTTSNDTDIQLQSTVAISGTLLQTPTVLNAKPIQTGDTAAGVAQRVMFDDNTVINPQLTVSMSDQQLYGYVTKGQSTALPAGLAVTYTSDRPGVVSIAPDQTIHTVGAGVATVTAKATYNGVSVSTSFVVDVAPLTITSNPTTTFQQGVAGTVAITTATSSGSPTASLTESGALPAGVTFTDNGNGTATIAGTPTDPVGTTFPITITAHNAVSSDATQAFTLTVGKAAAITSPASATFTIGVAKTVTVTTTGSPTATLTESGRLPSGLTFTDNKNGTASISGTAAAGTDGTSAITITANNGLGTAATQSFSLTVLAKASTPTTGIVSGTVTDASTNAAINGACVYLYPAGSSSAATYAICSRSNGSYELDNVAPGSYNVAFVDPTSGHVTQWYTGVAGGSPTQAGAATVTVTAGQALSAVNAALAKVPTGNITGTVTDSQTSAPLANICIYVYQVGNSASASYATCTAANGAFQVPGVTAGSYNVAFVDPTSGHVTQWYTGTAGGSPTQSAAKSVAVANGNATVANVNAALAAVSTGNVSGKVIDGSGNGVGNVCVFLYPHGVSTAASYATCTAADGTYSLSGVTAASYDVAFYDPQGRFTTQWFTGVAGGASSQAAASAVAVPNGNGTASAVNATIAPVATGTISGTVTDATSGSGLANVCVYLYQVGNTASAAYATCTAAGGTYSLSGVTSGSYNVAFADPTSTHVTQWYTGTAAGASSASGAKPVVVPNGNGSVSGINAALAAVATGGVNGTVLDATTGTPVANICVYVYKSGVSNVATAGSCTAANGTYSIGGIPSGSYNVAFYDPQSRYSTQWYSAAATQAAGQLVTVPGGNQTVNGIGASLAPVPTGNITGTVSAAGQPVGGVCVYLYQVGSGSASYQTCTAANGTYTISGVTPGSYDVAFFDPNGTYATQWYTGTAGGTSSPANALAVVIPTNNQTVSGIAADLSTAG